MEYQELIRERFSCRSFADTPVEKEKLDQILADGLAAPTSMHYQPFRVWVMESADAVSGDGGL